MVRSIRVGGVDFKVEEWTPGMPVLVCKYLAVDTETPMTEDGKTPELVMMQVCSYRQRTIQWCRWQYADQYKKELLAANPEVTWLFHNAPFDLRVLGGCRETPEWRLAVIQNRVVDTGLRFILHQLYHGKMAEQFGLAYAAKMLLGIDEMKASKGKTKGKNKVLTVRHQFHREMEFTDDAVKYAVKDAAVTAMLREAMPMAYRTEEIHVKGYIALSEIGHLGMLVDIEEMERVRENFRKEAEGYYATLALFGWRPKEGWEKTGESNEDDPEWLDSSGRLKGEKPNQVVQDILRDIEESIGVPLPRTEKSKAYQLNQRTVDLLWDTVGREHPFIKNYNGAAHCEKIISTYLKESLISDDGRVHPFFKPLMKTGRTSCSGPNIQNLPRKGGVRGIYVAPERHVLYACDYSQAELCSLAETCYRRYGRSVMRDVINSGEDLHRWFGEKIMEYNGGSPEDGVNYRQMAKPCNFGFPGGLGAAKFQQFARDTYGIQFTREQCVELKQLWLDAFPEMAEHLKPDEDAQHTIRRRIIKEDGTEEVEVDNRYIAQTINGRVRKNATYCSACNYCFQGLVADGAKMALWYLYLSGYRVVNFIHDEVIVELPLDDNLQYHVKRISDLMLRGMKKVIHHVEMKTEGALMRRWYKGAEEVFDDEGNLLIWEPTL